MEPVHRRIGRGSFADPPGEAADGKVAVPRRRQFVGDRRHERVGAPDGAAVLAVSAVIRRIIGPQGFSARLHVCSPGRVHRCGRRLRFAEDPPVGGGEDRSVQVEAPGRMGSQVRQRVGTGGDGLRLQGLRGPGGRHFRRKHRVQVLLDAQGVDKGYSALLRTELHASPVCPVFGNREKTARLGKEIEYEGSIARVAVFENRRSPGGKDAVSRAAANDYLPVRRGNLEDLQGLSFPAAFGGPERVASPRFQRHRCQLFREPDPHRRHFRHVGIRGPDPRRYGGFPSARRGFNLLFHDFGKSLSYLFETRGYPGMVRGDVPCPGEKAVRLLVPTLGVDGLAEGVEGGRQTRVLPEGRAQAGLRLGGRGGVGSINY